MSGFDCQDDDRWPPTPLGGERPFYWYALDQVQERRDLLLRLVQAPNRPYWPADWRDKVRERLAEVEAELRERRFEEDWAWAPEEPDRRIEDETFQLAASELHGDLSLEMAASRLRGDWFFERAFSRRHGDWRAISAQRVRVLLHVHFMVGLGESLTAARRAVAGALRIDPKNLAHWQGARSGVPQTVLPPGELGRLLADAREAGCTWLRIASEPKFARQVNELPEHIRRRVRWLMREASPHSIPCAARDYRVVLGSKKNMERRQAARRRRHRRHKALRS
jgi:hypothetical protein